MTKTLGEVGIDLEDVVGTYGPLPGARVIHLLVQACGSLAEAHARNLIHRDIKPANFFLCERGGEVDVVKVLDFGLVKSTEAQSARLSRDDLISGMPQYMGRSVWSLHREEHHAGLNLGRTAYQRSKKRLCAISCGSIADRR